MPKIYLIGKVNDFSLSVDFRRHRAIVRANTERVPGAPIGFKLEALHPGPNLCYPAMVLISRDWKKQYFVLEREGWTEDDYFNHAERLMSKLAIVDP